MSMLIRVWMSWKEALHHFMSWCKMPSLDNLSARLLPSLYIWVQNNHIWASILMQLCHLTTSGQGGVKARTKQITNNCCWIWLYPKTMTTINPSKFNPRYDCFKLGEKSSLDADTFVEGTNHMTIRVSKKTSNGCRTWRSFSKTIWVKFYSRGRGGSHWTRVT